jgi:uncharacterized protein YcnI
MKKSSLITPAVLGGIALALAVPLAASAHVTLTDNTAEAGSYSLITFKVPNESESATTSTITLHIPEATPFASVSYVPVPGWTTELATTRLAKPVAIGDTELTDAVTSVTWTSDDGHDIADGQLQTFTLSVGPVPDVDSVAFTVDQTYSDGSVVKWNDTSADAEEPAPVLYVNAQPAADHHASSTTTTTTTTAAPVDVFARVIGIVGLAVGAVGVVIAIASRRRSA